jgi:hypothetical protein
MPIPKPASIDDDKWAIFSAYFQDGLSVKGIGAVAGLSPAQVSHLLYGVDARLDAERRAGPDGKQVALESPIEDLALSLRARNALHSLGCERVRDALSMDLSVGRGMGHKTLEEVRAALRSSGFPHPELDEPLDTEIRSLNRSLERLQGRVTSALEAVTKEISQVQKRLRKRLHAREVEGGCSTGEVPPSWLSRHTAAASPDTEGDCD